ncbi:MAG TPA: choice-of-anchor R domain-containing protein [Verrucomicrobiae bacterium]|nr:choice-of-anchor R domain-containing protein [Verrucomicrobiae bacterium]
MKKKLVIMLVALLALISAQAQGVIYLSNLDEPANGSVAVTVSPGIFAPFTTGANPEGYLLDSVQLLMDDSESSVGFSIGIFGISSDPVPTPGAELGALNGSSNPSTAGIYIYTTSGITLLPDTVYFIGARTRGTFYWSLANSASYTSNDNWDYPLLIEGFPSYGFYYDGDGVTPIPYPLQFAISATPIPEPQIYALLGLSLAYIGFRRFRRSIVFNTMA